MLITKKEFNSINKIAKKNPCAATAYFYLSSLGEDIVVCSNTSLAAALGVSASTASTAVKALREEGLLKAFKVGTSYAYIVNPDAKLGWQKGDNDTFAEVTAKIVLSASEQGEAGEDIKTPIDIINETVEDIDSEPDYDAELCEEGEF